MAKKSQESVESQESLEELESAIEEAKATTGRTPHDIAVITREMSKMLQAVRMSKIEELAIGTYFVPNEGQLGVEGLINGAAELMNRYVRAGWQPWGMGSPYFAKASFNLGAGQTGVLEGQWIVMIWGKPAEELQ